MSIPPEVSVLQTTGYSTAGVGAARYVRGGTAGADGVRSADGSSWRLAEPRVTAEMFGAGTGEAAADAAAVQKALNYAAAHDGSVAIGRGRARTSPLSLPPRTALGWGELDIANTTKTGILLQADGARLQDLSLTSAGPLHEVIGSFGGTGGGAHVHIAGLRIDVRDAMGSANGLNLEQGGMSFWSMRDIDIDARGYGLLTSTPTGAAGVENMRVMDFTILSGGGDAIELNAPLEAQINSVVWGGHLKATPPSGKWGGFSLGMAHCQGFVAGGFVSIESLNEGLHIEDGSSMGVAAAFVLRRTGDEGIRHYRGVPNAKESGPIVFVGFATESRNPTPAPKTHGFYSVHAAAGVQGRSPIVAGYIRGYDTGLWLDGPTTHSVGYVSVENVNTVLRLGASGRAMSSIIYSANAPVLLASYNGGAEAGAFHQEGAAPQAIIAGDADPAQPPSCVAEFSGAAAQALPHAFGSDSYEFLDLFPAPDLLHGRLRIRLKGAGWIYWSGDVHYDGKAVTVSAALAKAYGPQAVASTSGPVIRIESGKVQLGVYSAKAAALQSVWLHFKGEYVL